MTTFLHKKHIINGVILLFLTSLIVTSFGIKMSENAKMRFPKDFIFSTATASYQIEGGWNENGKGENIWDRITHKNPEYIIDHSNGDIACDSYHKFEEDINKINYIGFKAYRFSLSWARILPTGDITVINKDGINYYMKIIDELLKHNIQPMVTLYHWDLPQKLQDLGGWVNPIIADYFEDYAHLVFSEFGSKVKWWITINEPSCIVNGYGGVDFAPALNFNGVGEYLAGHTLIKTHAKAYRLYEKIFKTEQKGKISFALNGAFGMPLTNSVEDTVAAERYNQFEFGWFAHPVFSSTGDYPPIMRDLIDRNSASEGRRRSRLPAFTQEEIEFIKGTYDFIGLNHYTSRLCTTGTEGENPSWMRDARVTLSVDPKWPSTGVKWNKVVPEGLRKVLNWIKKEYGNQTIFITENGYSDNATVVDDIGRIKYYNAYLNQLLKAINLDGCNVVGFTTWSILDNFEWRDGYTQKFGLYGVNFSDPERTRFPKASVEYFRSLIADSLY